MENKSFCFIIHVENQQIAKAAHDSICSLNAPDDCTINVLMVEGTDSTIEAYQSGMNASDAAYKIYLREHTIIRNHNLLSDLLNIFKDPSVGMVGVVGSEALSPSTKIIHERWENKGVAGCIQVLDSNSNDKINVYPNQKKPFISVAAVSDYFVATSVDLPWDMETFTRAHHGVADYSFSFLRKGLKVVVPYQKKPWCTVTGTGNSEDTRLFDAEKSSFLTKHKDYYPVVSVLIPAYNRPEWICDSIDSIFSQTYPGVSIVITDDSTDDRVGNMIKNRYLVRFKNIIYERNTKNLGLRLNMERSFSLANTEYCTFLSDDDMLLPLCFERQMEYFMQDNKKEISITSGYSLTCDANKNIMPSPIYMNLDKMFPKDTVMSGAYFANIELQSNATIFSGLGNVFRAEYVTESPGMMNGRQPLCNIDRYFGYTLLSKGLGVFISDALTLGRLHENQQQWKPLLVAGGGNDFFHEVISAPKYGFLRQNQQYLQALIGVRNYFDNFALKTNVIGRLASERELAELDLLLKNIKSLHEMLEKQK